VHVDTLADDFTSMAAVHVRSQLEAECTNIRAFLILLQNH